MIDLPVQVNTALALLNQAGFEAYVVGGAVRDAVRGGLAGQDWDVTTSALPDQVERVFSNYRLIETGLKHGTVTVLLAGESLEITTFRTDGRYSDHRRPDSVSFTPSLREDLARRDFTMNALAYHPDRGLIDYFGGVDDIRRGLIRCVGQPERRFQEDGLRILRALRFASQLSMEIEGSTAAALHRSRDLLRHIAAERIHSELTKLLCGANVRSVLREYADVIVIPLPELAPMFGFAQHNPHHDKDVWEHTLAVTESIAPEPLLRWAAFLHDIGKPGCFSTGADGVGHFYGHGEKSAELADTIMERLRFDTARRERIIELLKRHDQLMTEDGRTLKRLLGRIGSEATRQLIALHQADTAGQAPVCWGRQKEYQRVAAMVDELIAGESCFSLRDLAVNGNDFLTLGLSGPAVGEALDLCLNAVIDERVENENEALLRFFQNQH